MYSECTFSPKLHQSPVTERLARKRYEKDSANLSRVSSRIDAIYRLGKSPRRESPSSKNEEYTFKPKLNTNYQEIKSRHKSPVR
jgi:hypothetical protein